MGSQGKEGGGDENLRRASAGPLDEGWIEAFREIDRSRSDKLFSQVAGIFSSRVPLLLESFRRALREGDPEIAQEAAHSLASNYASVGALTFSQRCTDLEALVTTGNVEMIGRLLSDIEEGYEEVTKALQKELARFDQDHQGA